MNSIIRDLSLAAEGEKRIDWVQRYMPVLQEIRRDLTKRQAFAGKTIVMSIHLEAKTAFLATVLQEAGANVIVTGSNPLSTQDPIAAALVKRGLTVYATHGCTDEEYTQYLNHALDHKPHLILDDGGDVTALVLDSRKDAQERLLGGSEETTTGVQRLRVWDKEKKLQFPMVAVNDSLCKYLFDNRYGTGQSAWDGIIRTTNLTIAGRNVVVAGYGWCGKGVAMRAKGLGAHVYITEIDPIKAIEAVFDGFTVLPMEKAAQLGDVFVTVTGCKDVITKAHYPLMKDGAILCNAGHFDVEVNVRELSELADKEFEARQNIKGYTLTNGNTLFVLAEGRLVNLA
ncbi:MAG: adenosylhomocysteinase, partial [Negativicoccus succinicivorans]|uniref:adenosylhomocysteinase n=1 Tax=Negativicoccus succinicivorans TaxID=620903 RepID=UPI00290F1695